MKFEVDPAKYNHVCYIVAGGPSLKGFDWSLLTPDKFVVAINRSYEVLPHAQVLYFTDNDYWSKHKHDMAKHNGQMIRGAINPHKEKMPEDVIVYKLTGLNGLETKEGMLKHGSNSTYAALNLVTVHFGFKKVYLLGVDMKWGKTGNKGTSHWHDGHRRIDPETGYKKMMTAYNTIAPPLKDMGVKVYNANPDSALNTFPKITLEQAVRDEAD